MRIAFLGTPEIAAIILKDILDSDLNISAVITQPDRPCGRGQILVESAVKSVAVEKHIPIYQPEDKNELTATIKEIQPDICIVAAYGMIIPNDALEIPKHGMINFHPSLLPLLRGPSPIPMAIMCGHKKTGVSIIKINEKMDAGDILIQQEVNLTGKETTPTLSEELGHLGASMIVKVLEGIDALKPKKQDEKQATYTKIIKKTDGEIVFSKYHAKNIEQAYRAFIPWPGIYTSWEGKKIEIIEPMVSEGKAKPGEVISINGKISIGTAKGIIIPRHLKIEGKNKITNEEFMRGYPAFVGSVLK